MKNHNKRSASRFIGLVFVCVIVQTCLNRGYADVGDGITVYGANASSY
ncbi:MAG: hypothetical protein AAB019_04165 [Planctomycetota bacterium]